MFAVHVHGQTIVAAILCRWKTQCMKNTLIEANQLPCRISVYTQWILQNAQKNEQVFTHTLNWWTQVNVSTFRERHTESKGNNVTIHSMWCDRNSDDWNWLKCDVFGLCILAKLLLLLFFGISVDFSIRTEMNLLMSHQFNVLWIVDTIVRCIYWKALWLAHAPTTTPVHNTTAPTSKTNNKFTIQRHDLKENEINVHGEWHDQCARYMWQHFRLAHIQNF